MYIWFYPNALLDLPVKVSAFRAKGWVSGFHGEGPGIARSDGLKTPQGP